MSESAILLRDTALRLFAEKATEDARAEAEAGTLPRSLWDETEALGLPRLLAEAEPEDAFAVLRAAGAEAAPVPLMETMLASTLFAQAGIEDPGGPLSVAPVETAAAITAERASGNWRLTGTTGGVPWAAQAQGIAVLAACADGGGLLVCVEPKDVAVTPASGRTGDPRASVELDGVTVSMAAAARTDAETILRMGALMRAAQMAGALERVSEITVRYAGEREQFGRPLAKFQAIQQQLAVLASEAAAAVVAAREAIDALGDPQSLLPVASAKVRVGEAATRASAIAHQVHGAIGFTEEYALNHRTRRLWAWREDFGNERYWSEALGDSLVEAGADALWPLLSNSI